MLSPESYLSTTRLTHLTIICSPPSLTLKKKSKRKGCSSLSSSSPPPSFLFQSQAEKAADSKSQGYKGYQRTQIKKELITQVTAVYTAQKPQNTIGSKKEGGKKLKWINQAKQIRAFGVFRGLGSDVERQASFVVKALWDCSWLWASPCQLSLPDLGPGNLPRLCSPIGKEDNALIWLSHLLR